MIKRPKHICSYAQQLGGMDTKNVHLYRCRKYTWEVNKCMVVAGKSHGKRRRYGSGQISRDRAGLRIWGG